MFLKPRYISNSFAIIIPRQIEIRRKINDFEDVLRDFYGQPNMLPIPDEMDPELPRIVFTSKHGNSQVIITQINLVLNVTYTDDWQEELKKAEQYLIERVALLHKLNSVLEGVGPKFHGLTTKINLPCTLSDEDLLSYFKRKYLVSWVDVELSDIRVKVTKVIDEYYFSNIHLTNYRDHGEDSDSGDVRPMPRNEAIERGLQILCDFNDRYAYNERQGYSSSSEVADKIIRKGLDEVKEVLVMINGGE